MAKQNDEQALRQHCCCITGHRPEKLTEPEAEVIARLEAAIRAAIAEGFDTFICGMARGVDLWAAEIVLRLRAEGQPVRLVCASPHVDFERTWWPDWKKRYRRVWGAADQKLCISPAYTATCLQRRIEWMVGRSARVIAVFNGTPGGTEDTINYAVSQGVPVVRL